VTVAITVVPVKVAGLTRYIYKRSGARSQNSYSSSANALRAAKRPQIIRPNGRLIPKGEAGL
jgi:hypothetical protein